MPQLSSAAKNVTAVLYAHNAASVSSNSMKQSTQQDLQHAFMVKHVQSAIFTPPLWRMECRTTIVLKCNAFLKGTKQTPPSMTWDADSEPGTVCVLCLCGYWIRNLPYITFHLAEAIEVHSANRNIAYIKSTPAIYSSFHKLLIFRKHRVGNWHRQKSELVRLRLFL